MKVEEQLQSGLPRVDQPAEESDHVDPLPAGQDWAADRQQADLADPCRRGGAGQVRSQSRSLLLCQETLNMGHRAGGPPGTNHRPHSPLTFLLMMD